MYSVPYIGLQVSGTVLYRYHCGSIGKAQRESWPIKRQQQKKKSCFIPDRNTQSAECVANGLLEKIESDSQPRIPRPSNIPYSPQLIPTYQVAMLLVTHIYCNADYMHRVLPYLRHTHIYIYTIYLYLYQLNYGYTVWIYVSLCI